jgi:ADP-ribose pyrophosphatase YjhB (NUDIX family)
VTNLGQDPELDAAGDAPLTRVAAYALVVDEHDHILLVRVSPGYVSVGQWTLPGGGLKFGEDPADGVLRELTEETGYAGAIDALAFVGSWTRGPLVERGWGPFHGIQIVYRVHVTGGELRNETDESTDQAAWVPLADARQLPLVRLAQQALAYLDESADANAR